MKQYTSLNSTVYLWFAANDTSGSGGDGASPAADVRLAGAAASAAPVYSPTPSLLSHVNYPAGAYEIAIAATAANGFAANNTYAVFCTLAIDSQNPTGFVGSFDTKPVESNLTQIGGIAQSATDLKDFADAGYDPATNKVEGCKVNDDMVGAAPTVTAIRQEMDANSTKMAPSQTLNDYKATGFSTHNAAGVKTAIEAAGSSLAQILADTGELQGNQANWATATGFSTHNAAAVWSVATRILTANTNFNDLNAAAIKAEVVAALADIKLDHLINIAVDTDWATTVHLDSVIGHMADVGTAATFDRTTDALEALRVRGDSAWITATGFNTTTPPTVGQIRAEMEGAGYKLALIEADTNELQTDWVNGGRLDLILDIIAADTTTDIPALITALNNLSAADVNTQVADVWRVDTIAEMTQGAPPSSPTPEQAINYLYRKYRNKTETTSSEDAVYDDAGTTKLVKATISDDTVTFVKGEYVSGA